MKRHILCGCKKDESVVQDSMNRGKFCGTLKTVTQLECFSVNHGKLFGFGGCAKVELCLRFLKYEQSLTKLLKNQSFNSVPVNIFNMALGCERC